MLARQPIKVYDLQSVEVLREFGEGFEGATEICTFRFLSLEISLTLSSASFPIKYQKMDLDEFPSTPLDFSHSTPKSCENQLSRPFLAHSSVYSTLPMSLAARPNVATDIDRDSGERASTAGSSGPRKNLFEISSFLSRGSCRILYSPRCCTVPVHSLA